MKPSALLRMSVEGMTLALDTGVRLDMSCWLRRDPVTGAVCAVCAGGALRLASEEHATEASASGLGADTRELAVDAFRSGRYRLFLALLHAPDSRALSALPSLGFLDVVTAEQATSMFAHFERAAVMLERQGL
jgi:hypothetical protein